MTDGSHPRGATFLGNRCKRDHDGLRYLSTGACVHCSLLAAAKQKQAKKIKTEASDEVAVHLQPQQ